MTLDLAKFAADGQHESIFGAYEEGAIVALIIDFPEIMASMARFLTPDLFSRPEAKFAMAVIKQDFDEHSSVPSRRLLHDRLAKLMTVEDPYKEVLELVDTPSNPRDVPIIRASLQKWAQHKAFDLLYSDDAIAAHQRGDHEQLRQIVDEASSITAIEQQGFWYFEQFEELFVPNAIEHITVGFQALDRCLNDGGPSRGEVLVWLAPTGVGKSLMMINNAYHFVKQGLNVLLVTFEISDIKMAMRFTGAATETELDKFLIKNIDDLTTDETQVFRNQQLSIRRKIEALRRNGGEFVIYDLPPEEHSVDSIYGIVKNLQRMHGWTPDVVILDYLELMVGRKSRSNDDDYTRQKSVANEVRGLAKNLNVFVVTATQTNRSGANTTTESNINLDKQAESFGKAMPVDYVVSLNQTEDEYNGDPAIIRMFIAKNRNGQKFVSITTEVNYARMRVKEIR